MVLVVFDADVREATRRSSDGAVRVTGPPQTIFDWTKDACTPEDVPDSPVRAFRDASGDVQLFASHYQTRRMVGPSLERLEHRCDVVMSSDRDALPEQFDDKEWIGAIYSPDGRRVHALLHDEYQGNTHPGRCKSGEYLKCWYNAITYARSTDSGQTFHHGRAPPDHLIASVPYRYVSDAGPYGLFQPSNIVLHDGYFYALIRAQAFEQQKAGVCLIRTRTLDNPRSWSAWDGRDFTITFVNPYGDVEDPVRHLCQPVSPGHIVQMTQSLTFNTFLGRFVLVGESGKYDPVHRGTVWGIYVATSKDLIRWSDRSLVMETELPNTHECGDPSVRTHPSVVDPASHSRNFVTVGRNAYLYFTRTKFRNDGTGCRPSLDRDLLRVPITFSK
jgi:hypothetical protein